MIRHRYLLPYICLLLGALFISCGEAGRDGISSDPGTWEIGKEHLLSGTLQDPTNAYVRKLFVDLASHDHSGRPVSRGEFLALLDRPESREVYADQLVKVATPVSVKIQNREHRDFLNVFMAEKRVRAGVTFLDERSEILVIAEDTYGVARKDIVSILMWESGLGEFTGDLRVFNVLMGQLLFLNAAERHAVARMVADSTAGSDLPVAGGQTRRFDRIKRRCISNIVALLRQSKATGADPLEQRGSWGGAIGYPQFMPFSMGYAVDGDNDGDIDLHTWPDAIMSVGNYLKERGAYAGNENARRKAIHSYNPLDSYVNGVTTYADTIWSRYQAR